MKGKKLAGFVVVIYVLFLAVCSLSWLWQIPFSGVLAKVTNSVELEEGAFKKDTATLTVVLHDGETEKLSEFTSLQTADFRGSECVEEIFDWAQAHPGVTVYYDVSLPGGGKAENGAQAVNFTGIGHSTVSEYMDCLKYLPDVTAIDLGTNESSSDPLTADDLISLFESYPDKAFSYSFNIDGISYSLQDTELDLSSLKSQDVAYLDNAATAQRPQCVLDAVTEFYKSKNANPLRGLYPLSIAATEAYENAREAVRAFLNAKSSREIIFTRNTTESINLVAYSYGLSHVKAGDEVLVSIMEHHSNLLPWQMVCRQTGASLKFMECEMDGTLDLNKVEALITPKTKIVACTHVSNVLGRVNPIRELAALAHRAGAVLVVDGAQSTPHIPVDVQALDADFFAFSGHKVYGPMGIGVLYGREELLNAMPPFLTGGEMIESVTRDGAVFAELPHKFEAGTVNAADAVGLHAAIDYVKSIGFTAMHQQEVALTRRAMDAIGEMPHVHVLGSEKPEEHCGIITFTVDGVHPHDISEILASDGVAIRAGHHCAQPLLAYLKHPSTARASLAFYNTESEVDRLLDSISTLRERMGYGK